MKHFGDITRIDGAKIPVVDCITGGSPCQGLSIAGKRAGLADDRSGLFMQQIRIVREMRERDKARDRTDHLVRPRFMVWENVPGAFSSGNPKGADFAAVIEEIVKICEPGVGVYISIPDSGWPKSGCYYADDGSWSIAWRVHDAKFWGVPQRRKRIALVADFGGLSAPEILFERKGLRRYPDPCQTPWEKATGALRESPVGSGLDDTLSAGRPAVFDARGHGNGMISPTLTGDHQNRVTDYTALCVGNGQVGNITMQDLGNTLDTMHDQQAILTYGPDNNKNGYVGQASATQACESGGHAEFCCDQQMTVRRLTPLECERLQGYPDGWTDIGDWTDSNGKKRHTSDTARYKALGNSIALPFWFWLLRRISAQYERPATLGSLFDGIGGFPLCWERCNGKGTALWASEIEEFPIAVTKRRFGDD